MATYRCYSESHNSKLMKQYVIIGTILLNLFCFTVLLVKQPVATVWMDRPTLQRTVFIYTEELDDGREIWGAKQDKKPLTLCLPSFLVDTSVSIHIAYAICI